MKQPSHCPIDVAYLNLAVLRPRLAVMMRRTNTHAHVLLLLLGDDAAAAAERQTKARNQ